VKWNHAEEGMAAQSEIILRTLLEHGFEAYWVGGCVRDELMGRPIHDMDLTTSATPEEIMGLFHHTIPTGIQHGTVTVIMEGHPFEVTTYRVEGAYINHRRPEVVTFVTDIKEDLKRRDFTMNAIARAVDGTYIDPFGGQIDTQHGLIRAVGNSLERFDEDALRMVRCVRFASVFGYSISKDTWKGLLSRRNNLQYIALERVRVEMQKIMSGENPHRGLELLHRSSLLQFAKAPVCCARFDRELVSGLHKLSSEPSSMRWGLLLYAGGFSSSEAGVWLRKWTFSNQEKDSICGLLRLDEHVRTSLEKQDGVGSEQEQRLSWISMVLTFGTSTAEGWLNLQQILPERRRIIPTQNLDLFTTWRNQMKIQHLKELGVTGLEIMKTLDRPSGPWLREVLQHLLLVVAAGFIGNDKESLVNEIKRVCISHG
jgi:tRNA nucleotidyltransferase (CCA-adding enzyme)